MFTSFDRSLRQHPGLRLQRGHLRELTAGEPWESRRLRGRLHDRGGTRGGWGTSVDGCCGVLGSQGEPGTMEDLTPGLPGMSRMEDFDALITTYRHEIMWTEDVLLGYVVVCPENAMLHEHFCLPP